ncbi:YdcH family protein [Pseudomonas putida]|uniref:YdcH family protein n=1 Tax=Pseudomonas putida TaxID=303 RepID=UPI002366DE02|nr:YdcH family protein [Pseudomonas putida]MDD2049976.1 YdcH family protein [Pseudomonas putida]
MPVKHDLLADLGLTKEQFIEKKKTDPRLSQLHEEYNRKDTEVVEAENSSSADDTVTRLRKERLKIKDEIVAHVKS